MPWILARCPAFIFSKVLPTDGHLRRVGNWSKYIFLAHPSTFHLVLESAQVSLVPIIVSAQGNKADQQQ